MRGPILHTETSDNLLRKTRGSTVCPIIACQVTTAPGYNLLSTIITKKRRGPQLIYFIAINYIGTQHRAGTQKTTKDYKKGNMVKKKSPFY